MQEKVFPEEFKFARNSLITAASKGFAEFKNSLNLFRSFHGSNPGEWCDLLRYTLQSSAGRPPRNLVQIAVDCGHVGIYTQLSECAKEAGLRVFWQMYVRSNEYGSPSPLVRVVARNHVELVEEILKQDGYHEVDYAGRTALQIAQESKNSKQIESLLLQARKKQWLKKEHRWHFIRWANPDEAESEQARLRRLMILFALSGSGGELTVEEQIRIAFCNDAPPEEFRGLFLGGFLELYQLLQDIRGHLGIPKSVISQRPDDAKLSGASGKSGSSDVSLVGAPLANELLLDRRIFYDDITALLEKIGLLIKTIKSDRPEQYIFAEVIDIYLSFSAKKYLGICLDVPIGMSEFKAGMSAKRGEGASEWLTKIYHQLKIPAILANRRLKEVYGLSEQAAVWAFEGMSVGESKTKAKSPLVRFSAISEVTKDQQQSEPPDRPASAIPSADDESQVLESEKGSVVSR